MKFSSFVVALVFSLVARAEPAQSRIEKMSTEEKVGQLMIWTYSGTEFTPQTQDLIAKYKLGALISFSRNIKSVSQIAKFNSQAQAFAAKKLKAPLFMMVDQEGGMVTRVRVGTPMPSALAVGRMDDPKFVESYGKTNGELLSMIGFNINLAPVLDLSDDKSDTFISNRAFGNSPEKVTELAVAYARGIAAAGIVPTAKHFPGHGGNVQDSHQGVARKLATLEELEKHDLVPFADFISASFPKAMMMAHLALPNVDPSGLPATYSPLIIQEHLRGKMGFKGLLLTDDLEMGGAGISPDLGERAVRAFLAGNDMLMFAGPLKNQKRAFDAMVAAVKSGRISEERLHESLVRILELKDIPKFSLFRFEERKSKQLKTKLEALSREIMQKNFKDSLDSKSTQLPQITVDSQVLVLASDSRFHRNFQKAFSGRANYLRLTPRSLKHVRGELAKYELAVYYASGNVTAKWLQQLPAELRAKLIIVNCVTEGKIESQESFKGVLNINSASPESGGWLAAALSAPPELRTPAGTPEQTSSKRRRLKKKKG